MKTCERRWAAGVTAALALVAMLAGPARAQNVDAGRAQAQAALHEGNRLLEAGRATEALVKFEAAFRAFASPRILYNIGQAHAQIPGHEVQAFVALGRFLDEVKDSGARFRSAAEAMRERLRQQVALVRIAAHPPDAHLIVDGRDIGPVSGRPLALAAGTHVFMLRDDGQFSDTALVMIRGGEERSLDLRTKSGLSPAAATEPPPEPAPPLATRLAAAPIKRTTTSTATATATLTMPLPPPERVSGGGRWSLLEQWWFWTAVGAVAAGAATAAVLTAAHRNGGGPMPSCPNATVAGCQGL